MDRIVPMHRLYGKVLAIICGLVLAAVVGLISRGMAMVSGDQTLHQFSDALLIISGASLATAVVLFVIIWPLDKRGTFERLIVKSGIRQRNQMSTEVVAVTVGFLFAAALVSSFGYVVAAMLERAPWYTAFDRRIVVVGFLLTWLVATAAILFAFQKTKKGKLRNDLSIVTVSKHARGHRELVIRNDGTDMINLWKAKIEDTNGNYYQLNVDTVLRPGEKGTFELPEDFDLETVQYEVPFILKPFYNEQKSVSIYARSGEEFVLEYDETEHARQQTDPSTESETPSTSEPGDGSTAEEADASFSR